MSWFWWWFNLVEWVIRLGMVLVILRRRYTPAVGLAWLMVIFFQPVVGLLAYALVGGTRLGRKRVHRHRQVIAQVGSRARLSKRGRRGQPAIEPAHEPVIRQVQSLGGFTILGGNSVEFLQDADATVQRLVQDIEQARHHVHLLFYIFANDDTGQRVCRALIDAQRRGVTCRVLADATGSWPFFLHDGWARRLNEQGVRALPTLPAAPLRRKFARLDLRNHRKLAIIDGTIAYAGSQNVVNPDYGRHGLRWVDLMGRFTGPVVSQLQAVFAEDWAFETGEELPDPPPEAPPPEAPVTPTVVVAVTPNPLGPDSAPFTTVPEATSLSPPSSSSSRLTLAHDESHTTSEVWAQTVPTGPSENDADALPRALLAAIHAAQKRLIITTPYLVPDEPTTLALAMAVDRGVETTVVLPEAGDHPIVAAAGRAYFEELLGHGVRLFLYQGGLLHAKTMTVDDSFALLGSSNLDVRSFYLNFELNVLMYGKQVTGRLRAQQMLYITQARQLTAEEWSRRSRWAKYGDRAVSLLSPLL